MENLNTADTAEQIVSTPDEQDSPKVPTPFPVAEFAKVFAWFMDEYPSAIAAHHVATVNYYAGTIVHDALVEVQKDMIRKTDFGFGIPREAITHALKILRPEQGK